MSASPAVRRDGNGILFVNHLAFLLVSDSDAKAVEMASAFLPASSRVWANAPKRSARLIPDTSVNARPAR
ncbi:MAG: hypothetical protein R2778_04180 [Saprospiraceae bacterium]